MKKVAILGSTGSIGVSTLKVIEDFPDRFEVVGLAAGSNYDLLADQIRRFKPKGVSICGAEKADKLRREFNGIIEVGEGEEGAKRVAACSEADMVVCAIVGAAGLVPTYAAIEAGKDIALANKETLVVAGSLITPLIKEKGVKLLPVDSEHNAIFQCLQGQERSQLKKIILTASGGPFANFTFNELSKVTPKQALAHPTWSMGAKISLDSATLMNKGLEVIEAHWLFDVSPQEIDVVIHPQSVIHSLIEMRDGSVLAQMGVTDMRLPILFAMSYPERWENKLPEFSLAKVGELTFSAPDTERFPCLKLAYQALESGGSMPLVLNALNEVIGKAFLDSRISFNDIPALIQVGMDKHQVEELTSLEHALSIDKWARNKAAELIQGMK